MSASEQPKRLVEQAIALVGQAQNSPHGSQQADFYARAARLMLSAGEDETALALAEQANHIDATNADAAFVRLKTARQLDPASQQALLGCLCASEAVEHLLFAANSLAEKSDNPLTLPLFLKLRQRQPNNQFVRMWLIGLARSQCAYDLLMPEEDAIKADIAAGRLDFLEVTSPHANLIGIEDEALNRRAGYIAIAPKPSDAVRHLRHSRLRPDDGKIRIGYLSGDFWDNHAVLRLARSVIAAHDRHRFDVTLICYTPDHLKAFDEGGRQEWGRILTIGQMSDDEAEACIRSEQFDIIVDLQGHTRGSRSQLMNRALAPVHVQWLGFPGSCQEVDCDYVIGDRFVLPDSSLPHYHEKFCRLPESYQPNDPVHRPLPPPAQRLALGLPAERPVIGAFNTQWKNTPATIRLWARVLKDNPQALLSIMIEGQAARQATAACFKSLGIKQSQLHFAPKLHYAHHLARVQACDFALDAFPYNGHTTTSDLLWAGVPVITKKGSNFASRVSESLLNAIGLAELVAEDEDGFVALANSLIAQPEKRAAIRTHLEQNRFIAPLFDAERFCRHLETAFTMMMTRARAGEPPDHFDVSALPPRQEAFISRSVGCNEDGRAP
ncbi:hypothetical protein NAC44_15235 [Allorhizobium sp. BGMRC 0089]|uniref:O-linked N-acetylglucosamine transferase, SPINDLY family protein n=1 Tax=Allorhizobium sonneratiae TaxID=2934936 RepID=UPI00203331B6|nr:hypothetical protein [Allorhizobium sonneratiae]MCM2293681.1 hypothetical protein [Allorhizobium sonneratiae]